MSQMWFVIGSTTWFNSLCCLYLYHIVSRISSGTTRVFIVYHIKMVWCWIQNPIPTRRRDIMLCMQHGRQPIASSAPTLAPKVCPCLKLTFSSVEFFIMLSLKMFTRSRDFLYIQWCHFHQACRTALRRRRSDNAEQGYPSCHESLPTHWAFLDPFN